MTQTLNLPEYWYKAKTACCPLGRFVNLDARLKDCDAPLMTKSTFGINGWQIGKLYEFTKASEQIEQYTSVRKYWSVTRQRDLITLQHRMLRSKENNNLPMYEWCRQTLEAERSDYHAFHVGDRFILLGHEKVVYSDSFEAIRDEIEFIRVLINAKDCLLAARKFVQLGCELKRLS